MSIVLTNEKPEIRGFLSVTGAIKGVIRRSVPELRGIISSDIPEKETYNGPLIVTPRADGTVSLDTDDKIVPEDIIVEAIPYYETSNPSGGYTVFIG